MALTPEDLHHDFTFRIKLTGENFEYITDSDRKLNIEGSTFGQVLKNGKFVGNIGYHKGNYIIYKMCMNVITEGIIKLSDYERIN